jgi:RNA polymerase sigma-70 factor (ECF subfamily)
VHLDPDLLHAAHSGDRKAQYTLYKACFPVLMAVCARYRKNQQDAVASLNNGFLKIVQNIPQFQQKAVPFEAWARRVMINTLIDEYRREKNWHELTVLTEDIGQSQPKASSTWNEADQQLDAQFLESLLHKLPPMTHKVFNLFALDGFSHQEISELLGMSEGTSKWHVSFARAQLQTWIKNAPALP